MIFLNKNRSIFHLRAQYCNTLSIKEMTMIDGYGDEEGRCDMWKEKKERPDK